MAKVAKHECPYCGATDGLRIAQDGREYGLGVDLICEDDYSGGDEGPCFDDLPVWPEPPAPAVSAEQEAREFCEAIQLAVGMHKNPDFAMGYLDGLSSTDAARNLLDRKPAFGWTTSYSNASAGTFAATVNMLAGIEEAQDDLAAHFARNGRDVTDEQWLDNLLPLNREAVMDLMRAYQRVGTFRTPAELEGRTKRYLPATEGAPVNLRDAVYAAYPAPIDSSTDGVDGVAMEAAE